MTRHRVTSWEPEPRAPRRLPLRSPSIDARIEVYLTVAPRRAITPSRVPFSLWLCAGFGRRLRTGQAQGRTPCPCDDHPPEHTLRAHATPNPNADCRSYLICCGTTTALTPLGTLSDLSTLLSAPDPSVARDSVRRYAVRMRPTNEVSWLSPTVIAPGARKVSGFPSVRHI